MDIGERLARELNHTMTRLRGGMALADGAAIGNETETDEMDAMRRSVEREIDSATRSLLIKRVNRLADALTRVQRGSYGICEECGEPIEAARLAAAPEVATCLRCQSRRELAERRRGSRDLAPASFDE